jgi:hypothetical protein
MMSDKNGGLQMKNIIRRLFLLALCMNVVIITGLIMPRTAESKIVTNVPADISGEELKALVIEDFEGAKVGGDGWTIKSTPKQFTNASTSEKLKMKNPVPALEAKILNGKPNDLVVEEWSLTGQGKTKEKCLGVHFRFRYPGHNAVSLIPPKEISWRDKSPSYTYHSSTNQNVQERGIQLPGRSKAISVWVHARGRPYTLEVWVKDYKGNTHVLPFGSINFVGWRPMKVYIPITIPQEEPSYPATRITKITRFVIRSTPMAVPGDSYVFLDQIKVLTDTYEVNFDGQDLHKAFGGGESSKPKGGGGTGPK